MWKHKEGVNFVLLESTIKWKVGIDHLNYMAVYAIPLLELLHTV